MRWKNASNNWRKKLKDKLSEDTEFTIPLKNLVSLAITVALAVWLYFGLVERIAMMEYKSAMHEVSIEKNFSWTEAWTPPPEVAVAVERVRLLELKVKELETRLELTRVK